MKVAIIGSRDFNDYKLLCETLKPYQSKITEIISGGARGADELGARWCKEFLKKEPIIFEAKWDDFNAKPCLVGQNKDGKFYNTLAGFNRNTDIVKACDVIIAFWDGISRGTKDSLDKAKKMKKPIKLVIYG